MAVKPTKAIEVFFSYSHEDEQLRNELEKHLAILERQGVIMGWHDRRIGAGREWEGEIDTHLNTADVILLLISADFLASDYCYDIEMKRAMERHEAGEARVIPVILRPVDWKGAPFGKLQALPKDAKPVTTWPNRDGAFLDVARGIRAAVEELAGPPAGPLPSKRVQIYLRGDLSSLSADRRSAAIDAFAVVMGISPQAIDVYRVYPGSIVFDLGIPSDAAQRLRFLLQSNNTQLRLLLGVEKIILETESGEIEEWVIEEGKFDLVTSLEQEIAHLQKLQAKHRQNTRTLEEQLASYGMKRPLELLNELEFEREQLRQVEERLKELTAQAETARPPRHEPPRLPGPPLLMQDAESVSGGDEITRQPSAKTEPPTRVVDPMHRRDHTTITEAIEAANPGDRILIRPGLYEEALVMDKPLEIIGEGSLNDVVIQATGGRALLFKTTRGRVANLTLRQMGNGEFHCVDITQGCLELEGCDIASQSRACVAIHGGANPRLHRNRIHDGNEDGVYIYDNGQGILEHNHIFDNAHVGVEVKTGGNATLRHNHIYDNKKSGVYIYDNGQGMLEDNDIFRNAFCGVKIEDSSLTLHHNRIYDNSQDGVYIYDNSRGRLEHNYIFGNDHAGVEIARGSNPTLRSNHIHDCKQTGVYVRADGLGLLEDNDILDNAEAGVTITTGGNPTLRHNRINKNGYVAVQVYDGGGGTIKDNDLSGNAQGAWDISPDSEPNVIRAGNLE